MRILSIVLVVLSLAAGGASAQPPASAAPDDPLDPPVVVIPGTKIALTWPWRTLAAGIEEFADERALAPHARLRFRLLLADGVTALDGVALTLVDGDTRTPVPITPDGYFTLGDEPHDDAATLAANRNGGQFDANRMPQPDVRTPGLPDNVRRLGDLRLECRIKMAMAKDTIGFVKSALISTMVGRNWCAPRMAKYGDAEKTVNANGNGKEGGAEGGKDRQRVHNVGYSAAAAVPAERATLSHGTRTLDLPLRRGTAAKVPIGDTSWPDDALLTFAPATP